MLLVDDRFPQPHGPLTRLADMLGTAIAGDTAPTGFRLYVANKLVQRAGGVLLFDEDGNPVPVPEQVLKGGSVPRGVLSLRVDKNGEATTHAFSRRIRFDLLGVIQVSRHANSSFTFAEGAS